tara:strand:+ start:1011 stop:1217 length:207 start_codon:yes stop_codon:yes gene_type:complete
MKNQIQARKALVKLERLLKDVEEIRTESNKESIDGILERGYELQEVLSKISQEDKSQDFFSDDFNGQF